MANPVTIHLTQSFGGGTAEIYYYAKAEYSRSGSKITVNITNQVYSGKGHYFQAWLNGSQVIAEENKTVVKTFTYDTPDPITLSYEMEVYIQSVIAGEGKRAQDILTIDIPAMDGYNWKKVSRIWIKLNGAWQ